LILRVSQWKQQDFTQRLAHSPQEWEQFLSPLVEAGVDIFHCSTRRYHEPEFEGSNLNLAGWTKRLTGKPTITVGGVGLSSGSDFIASLGGRVADVANIDDLLDRLSQDEFDLVAIGRALVANPDWPAQLRKGTSGKLKSFEKDMLSDLV
jgi:2,4-dienoyl-CoA reductase-like NADH-dependent reductase (Old Yellow Enzyme family)